MSAPGDHLGYPAVDPEGLGRNFDPLRDPVGSDADMATAVAHQALTGFCWAGGLGWRRYDDKLGTWPFVTEEAVAERVRRWMLRMCAAVLELAATETRAGKSGEYYEKLADSWRRHATASRIFSVTRLARGICLTDPSRFDAHPDLLNTPNGVVDLRTGKLGDHDPALLFTQVTGARYVPGAFHADIDKALQAIPEEVRRYAQLRYGQGITGHKPPDDVIDVQHGNGENGKTTILAAIKNAAGDYAAVLPTKLMLANPNDHTTDLMTLRGVRFGIIEELPEDHQLSVNRIKIATAIEITARFVHKDNVTFANGCSLYISTNYRLQIRETDHGTWRRLEGSIPYPYTFRKPHEPIRDENDRPGDGTLRERVITDKGKRAEAMLAWLVSGAVTWYAGEPGRAPMTMGPPPEMVVADVRKWRESCDLVYGYITARLEFAPDAHVTSEDLLADFNLWLRRRGHHDWSAETLTARFEVHSEVREHRVGKGRPRGGQWPGLSRPSGREMMALPERYTAFSGVRFQDPAGLSGSTFPQVGQGGQGFPKLSTHESYITELSKGPDHPVQRSFTTISGQAGMHLNGNGWAALYAAADHDAAMRIETG